MVAPLGCGGDKRTRLSWAVVVGTGDLVGVPTNFVRGVIVCPGERSSPIAFDLSSSVHPIFGSSVALRFAFPFYRFSLCRFAVLNTSSN